MSRQDAENAKNTDFELNRRDAEATKNIDLKLNRKDAETVEDPNKFDLGKRGEHGQLQSVIFCSSVRC